MDEATDIGRGRPIMLSELSTKELQHEFALRQRKRKGEWEIGTTVLICELRHRASQGMFGNR